MCLGRRPLADAVKSNLGRHHSDVFLSTSESDDGSVGTAYTSPVTMVVTGDIIEDGKLRPATKWASPMAV